MPETATSPDITTHVEAPKLRRARRRPALPDFSQLPAHPSFEAKVRALILLRAAVAKLERKEVIA